MWQEGIINWLCMECMTSANNGTWDTNNSVATALRMENLSISSSKDGGFDLWPCKAKDYKTTLVLTA